MSISVSIKKPRTALVHLAALAALSTAACSLTVVDAAPCASDSQCDELFGGGAICGAGGFCEVPAETSESASCENTSDCLAAVGFGQICVVADTAMPGVCESIEVLSRCNKSVPADLKDDLGAYRDRVVIGVLSDQSIRSHTDREDAIELAIEQLNENSGLGDAQLGAIFCDIGPGTTGGYSDALARPDAAEAATDWLVNQASVPGIIGAPSSNDTQLLFEEVVNKPDVRGNTVVISPSATDPSLADFDVPAAGAATDNNPGLLWRTAGDGSAQIDALVADMETAMLTNIIIVREQSPFAGTQQATGGSFAQSFLDNWSGEGEQKTYPGGSPSARDQAIRDAAIDIAEGDFDGLLFVGPTEDAKVALALLTDSDVPDEFPIYFDAAGSNNELFSDVQDSRLFPFVRAARPLIRDTSEYGSFESAFMSSFGYQPSRSTFTAQAYDAVWLLAAGAVWAIEQGDSTISDTASGLPVILGEDIARGMRKTTTGTTVSFVPNDWARVITQFKAGRAVDVTGAASNYDFNLGDEQAPADAEIVVGSENGTFSLPE